MKTKQLQTNQANKLSLYAAKKLLTLLILSTIALIPAIANANEIALTNAISACNAALQHPVCNFLDQSNHPKLKICSISANGRNFQARGEEQNAVVMEVKNQCYAAARQTFGN